MYLEHAQLAFLTTLVVLVSNEVAPNRLTPFQSGTKLEILFYLNIIQNINNRAIKGSETIKM